jgi:hypothetical protein
MDPRFAAAHTVLAKLLSTHRAKRRTPCLQAAYDAALAQSIADIDML